MEAVLTIVAAGTAGTVLRYAAAFFLVVVAVGLVYMLLRAGKALQSVDKLVTDLDAEVVPVINKAGTTVDEVNAELDKVNDITASVAEMTERVDAATRAVESVLSTPAKKAAAFTSGITQTVSSFFGRYGSSWRESQEAPPSAQDASEHTPAPGAGTAWTGAETSDAGEQAAQFTENEAQERWQ
jgi:uncharacterized protein YoxC